MRKRRNKKRGELKMAGWCDRTDCPFCGKDTLEVSGDTKYPNEEAGFCLSCGKYKTWKIATLKEVNSLRKDLEMRPLKKLIKVKE